MSEQYVQAKKKNPFVTFLKIVGVVVGVIVVISVAASLANSGNSTSDPVAVVAELSSKASPNDSGKTNADKPKDKVTKGQEQALKKAESYLGVMPFSKDGLAKQLQHDEFSKADAEWAVDNVGADWNEQAVKKALSYLDVMAFSESDLADQLEHDGFTKKQAAHGASEAYKQ